MSSPANNRAKLNRRQFLARAGGALAAGSILIPAGCLSARKSAPRIPRPGKPNVLFIGIDDLSTSISAFDNPKVATPNIEALARRGMAFTRAYCQFPLCSPSRTSIITGLRPETTGVISNNIPWRQKSPDAVSLPQHFSAHGYETILIGKMLHGPDNEKGAGWDRVIHHMDGVKLSGKKGRELQGILTDKIKAGKEPGPMDKYYQFGPSGLEGTDELDGRFAFQAIKALSEKREKPFFLAVGFGNPHLPWTAPDRFFEMYPPESVDLPDNPDEGWEDLPDPIRIPPRDELMGRPATPELVRELKAAYQACCSYVDYSIGQVLGALKENGLEENTVVVLWSDHGSMVGAHGSWGKNCLWEEACRVPLVVAAPWIGENAGKRCSRFVELVDMYPTLADLCGLPAPEKAEGLSMAPLLRDPGRTWKKAAFTTVRDEDRNYTGRGLRTEKWRYAEYNGPAEAELYDRIADPGESANLAGEKEYASVVAELSRLLEQGWRAALPESK